MTSFVRVAMILLPWFFLATFAGNEPVKSVPGIDIDPPATFSERWLPLEASEDESEDDEIGRCRYEQQLREGLERKAKELRAD